MKTLIHSILATTAVFIILGLISCEKTSTDSEWVELGGPNASQFDGGPVQSIATDALGNIYAAGAFSDDINHKLYVAKWDISTNIWSELGTNTSSFNEGIRAPIVIDAYGNVYAIGQSRTPETSSEMHVAKLDIISDTWSELGGTIQPSFNNGLFSIVTDASGNVYAAGDFIDFDNPIIDDGPFVAKWNKSTDSWSKIGQWSGLVFRLAIDASGNVYAGGDIRNVNTSCYVAKWDGSNWSELGGTVDWGPLTSTIDCIAIDNWGNVYAAGNLDLDNLRDFASWNMLTNTWSSFGDGELSGVNAIAIDASRNVYAAGTFTNSSNKTYVAKWDGSKWNDYGNLNANDPIYSLFIDASGNMYAGGEFTNDHHNHYVAVYYK